jgi:uncharacterized protein GlcG (DUF336 family)
VEKILAQGVATANGTRAAIRRPLGSPAQVSLTVVDTDGKVLGLVRTPDAPIFGVDVSAQKSRTAAFFSANVELDLILGGMSSYVDAAKADGIKLDGSVAFSDRGNGFLSRPFFPDGIDGNPPGPFSRPIGDWSVFNDGLQVDLVAGELSRLVSVFNTSNGIIDNTRPCTPINAIPHGIQIFAGSVPLYKNGTLVGAVGVSGDGIDQDDYISSGASAGFEAPKEKRCDRVFVRGVRLPFTKFPRHPNL